MPEFNELGGGALGLNEGLGRVLGMEKLGPAPTLVPEISPSLDLIDPPDEWRAPLGEKLFWFGTISAAVVGEFSYGGISNPAGSGVIAVVSCVFLEGAGAATVRYRITDTPTVDAGVIPRDLRWPAAQVGTTHYISGAEPAATGAQMGTFTIPAAGAADLSGWLPINVVLGPGTNVVVERTSNNTALTSIWIWRERRARPEELAFS